MSPSTPATTGVGARIVPNEVGVATFNPSLDERPSALHGSVEEFDQRAASLGVESVGVSDEPKTGGKIQIPEPEATGVEVIVDGHAHPSEGCEVKEWPSWCGKVEVQECDGFTIPEDDVLKAYVVVADHRPATWISQFVTPHRWDHGQSRRSLVERPDQGGDRGECLVSLHPDRERRYCNVPFDEEQPFPPVRLDLDWQRCSLESG